MIKIEKLNNKTKVFDINVENNHNFYANDILVHNCQEINLPTSPIYDVQDGKTIKKRIKISKKDYDEFLKIKGDNKEIYIKSE
jgi:hypothetical protein